MKTPIEKLLEIITLKEKENAIYLMPIIDKIDIDKLISEEKQLRIGSVSQQRELLLAYEKYTSQQVIGKENSRMAKSLVDGFLANNCG